MSYFIGKGISKERLTAKGYNFSRPVNTNNAEEGRAKNRRMQLKPIYEKPVIYNPSRSKDFHES
jgi:outer membrane protein OmpA-like peptidoglycan-associated protein